MSQLEVQESIVFFKVVDYHMKAINDDRVKCAVLECVEPSPISPADSLAYTLLEHTTRQVYPEAIIVPSNESCR